MLRRLAPCGAFVTSHRNNIAKTARQICMRTSHHADASEGGSRPTLSHSRAPHFGMSRASCWAERLNMLCRAFKPSSVSSQCERRRFQIWHRGRETVLNWALIPSPPQHSAAFYDQPRRTGEGSSAHFLHDPVIGREGGWQDAPRTRYIIIRGTACLLSVSKALECI